MKNFMTIKQQLPIFLVLILAGVFLPATTVSATNWTVCTIGNCDYLTIQDAINNATAGDTIDIGAEIFSEDITIDKDLDLTGAGEALTTIEYGGNTVVTVIAGVTAKLFELTIYGGMGYEGGGVHNEGSLLMRDVTIDQNFALSNGGGIWSNGDLSLNRVTVSNNIVDAMPSPLGMGGGIYIKGNNIYDIEIKNSLITNNSACNGGGLYNDGGHLELFRTTVSDNIAGFNLMTCANHAFADGAGMVHRGFDGGSSRIKKSTFKNNEATQAGGAIAAWYNAVVTITNSTISGNVANTYGGGIYVYDGPSFSSTVILNNATVTNNSAVISTGGIHIYPGLLAPVPTNVTIRNSIVADQALGADCGQTFAATFTSANYNIESGVSCGLTGVGDQQNTSPALDTLANNTGLTDTHSFAAGTPADNNAHPVECRADLNGNGTAGSVLNKDQRGNLRNDGSCDVGAFEL